MMYAQTPLIRTEIIDKAANKVVPGGVAEFIPVAPSDGAIVAECFKNVGHQIKLKGGSVQYGWNIFIWPRVWIEFEFHCIWRKTTGELFDITPRSDGEQVVLFLQDPSRAYKGLSRDNVRFSLSDSPLVKELIELSEKQFFVINKKQKPYSEERIVDPHALNQIANEMKNIYKNLNWQPVGDDACPCGSRKKYKHCHQI